MFRRSDFLNLAPLGSFTMEPLVDSWGREIKSVRVSVTDKCNFRCRYCMPAEGLEWLGREEILSFEELERVVRLLAAMGVEEVRLTGGEPLVRRELPVLVSMLAEIEGVTDLSLTTNGVLLDRLAGPLVDAGLKRLNVSLDSLSHVRFAEITRRDALDRVLAGLAEAEQYSELRPIKVNCVAIRGFTEEEVPALAELARRRRRPHRRRDPRADRRTLAARGDPGEGVIDRAAVPIRRRHGRGRVRQPRLGAVLLLLRPDPPHRRRPVAHLPLLAARVGPEDPAA
jgi:uncharacterized Fe-S cluster-containing radical SAM superfamily enzyme